MKINYLRMIFLLAALLAFVGCSEGQTVPVLLHGEIHAPDNTVLDGSVAHAYVRLINTSDNETVASVKVTDINYFPAYYEIRQNYYDTFKDYWGDYVVTCLFYHNAGDTTPDMTGQASIDLTDYKHSVDIDIKSILTSNNR